MDRFIWTCWARWCPFHGLILPVHKDPKSKQQTLTMVNSNTVHENAIKCYRKLANTNAKRKPTFLKNQVLVLATVSHRNSQDSLAIPIASWECKQATPIKNKHFQALKPTLSQPQPWVIFEIEVCNSCTFNTF